MPKRNTVRPNILVLEGLWADTAELVEVAGGHAFETTPWSESTVKIALKSGRYHGLLLTGGSDVNPQLYGEEPHKSVYGIDHTRDSVELFALEEARRQGMAVLGICRGSQIMCVSQGGKLTQDVETFLNPVHAHRSSDHPVYAVPGAKSFRRAMRGTSGKFTSLHHQCVRRPGRGMRIAARAADGTIEAIESKDGLMLGVQFHPEISATHDETAFGFFRWLVEAAARVAGGVAEKVSYRDAMDEYFETTLMAYEQAKEDAVEELTGGYKSPAWGDWEEDLVEYCPPRSSRKAGDPAIPSMRESLVAVIEETTGSKPHIITSTAELVEAEITRLDDRRNAELGGQMQVQRQLQQSLLTCPDCAIRFDCVEDRDDHCKYVHPRLIDRMGERYPELCEPPVGHPAWADADEDEYERLMLENGFDPRDWDDYDD